MLEGVVAARNRRYLMLNAAGDRPPAIRAILPGMGAPSVLPLAEPGQIAVHAAVRGRRHLGAAAAAEERRRLVDPRRPGREALSLECGGDRRRRCATGGTLALADGAERLGDGKPERVEAEGALERALASRRARSCLCCGDGARRRSARRTQPVSPLPGIEVERRWLPLDSVGIYVPGRPVSSLVMTAVPARVAGGSPDRGRHAASLARDARARRASSGSTRSTRWGGAQAIAALAYGTETIRPVAKIVGPGNRWVTEAKLLVSGQVAIDLPAGPSEVLVIADDTRRPGRVRRRPARAGRARARRAAILVTTSERVAD
jgi:hypothetical protein